MNKIITLFEHQTCNYSDLDINTYRPLIQGIEQLNQESGIEYIRLGYKTFKATQYVGVIRVGDITLQILPKIDCDPIGDFDACIESEAARLAIQSATRNLLYMLAYAQNLKIHDQEVASLSTQSSDWFELLIRLLAVDLHNLMQRGLVHQYVIQEDSLPVMRGRWRIEHQLTRNPQVKPRFDVIYDEFSPDNLINQIFRYVVKALLIQTRDSTSKALLLDLNDWLRSVRSLSNVSQNHLDRIVFTRLNDRYHPAFNLARMFIEHTTMQFLSGAQQTFVFVFDMNGLFEMFVAKFLERHRYQILPESLSKSRIRIQSEGRPAHLASRIPGGNPVFRLRPDILVDKPGGSTQLILDTKYKELNSEQRKVGVSEGDFYQMLAYRTRFDCPQGLLLYPQSSGTPPLRARFDFQGNSGHVIAATINLHTSLENPKALIQEMRGIFDRFST